MSPRLSNSCIICKCGWKVHHNNKPFSITCPRCTSIITNDTEYTPPPPPPNLWRELHIHPILNEVLWVPEDAEVFFANWLKKVSNCNNCRKNFEAYCKSTPPDFTSSEGFFEWSIEAHNYVSTNHVKPPKPTITIEEAYHLYRYYMPVPSDLDLIPKNQKKLLVITIAAGEEYEELLNKYTRSSMQHYANKIGADFIVLTGTTQKWWGLEKFRCGPLVERYERTLFLDCDVLVRENSPNIFNEVPINHIGMHDDWKVQGDHNWHRLERNKLWASQGILPEHPNYMRNSGVIVADRMHADIWTPPKYAVPGNHCDEQFWIERWTKFYNFYELPTVWNTQWYYPDFEFTRNSAYFLHFACCPKEERVRQLEMEQHHWAIPIHPVLPPENWWGFKQLPIVSRYPDEPFKIPKDISGWSTPLCIETYKQLSHELGFNDIILELGSFLGSVSTQAFLDNPLINLICVDKFNHKTEWVDPKIRPFGDTPYFLGEGTCWQHFVNNTFNQQKRIAPLTMDAGSYTLQMLADLGIVPKLILVDADHEEHAVLPQIEAITRLWPLATIILDDYSDEWPGVKTALAKSRDAGLFNPNDTFTQIDNRIMVIKRNPQ